MPANLARLSLVWMIVVLCCVHSYGRNAPQVESPLVASDFERIIPGMTYQQVSGVLGKPCFEKELPGTPPWADRVWRTSERGDGLYVSFREGKVVGIATFKRGAPTITFKKGDYNSWIITDQDYRNEVMRLLESTKGPETFHTKPVHNEPATFVAGAAPQGRPQVKITYASGRTVVLKTWAFEYLFIESERPKSEGTYSASRRSDQALFVRVPGGKNSSEMSDKRLEAKDLKSILFGWDFTDKPPSLNKIIIETSAGESFVLRDTTSSDYRKWLTGDFTPATALLSKARYVFGAGYCPCIVLKGKTSDAKPFEEVISAMEQGATRTRDETISLVTFQ